LAICIKFYKGFIVEIKSKKNHKSGLKRLDWSFLPFATAEDDGFRMELAAIKPLHTRNKKRSSGRYVGDRLIIYGTTETFDLLAIAKGSSRTIMLFCRLLVPKQKVLRAFLQHFVDQDKKASLLMLLHVYVGKSR
jgi:hypothetical protein